MIAVYYVDREYRYKAEMMMRGCRCKVPVKRAYVLEMAKDLAIAVMRSELMEAYIIAVDDITFKAPTTKFALLMRKAIITDDQGDVIDYIEKMFMKFIGELFNNKPIPGYKLDAYERLPHFSDEIYDAIIESISFKDTVLHTGSIFPEAGRNDLRRNMAARISSLLPNGIQIGSERVHLFGEPKNGLRVVVNGEDFILTAKEFFEGLSANPEILDPAMRVDYLLNMVIDEILELSNKPCMWYGSIGRIYVVRTRI